MSSLGKATTLMARLSLFVIYFWFGLLKVIGQSPASPMVQSLFSKTLAHMPMLTMSPSLFVWIFGFFEIIIGILFFIPGWEKTALVLFFIHIITTALPLFILHGEIWSHLFVPTLEGQYIIKNIALITCALVIAQTLKSKTKLI